MSKPLFRSEVSAAKRSHSLGSIRVETSAHDTTGKFGGLASAAGALLFLCTSTYTRHDRVAGQLLPSAGLLAVTASGGGRVVRLMCTRVTSWRPASLCMRYRPTSTSSTVGAIGAAIDGELETQRRRLQKDLDEQTTVALEADQEAKERITLLHEQEALAAAQHTVRERQRDSVQQLLDALHPLANDGKISKFEFDRQQALALDAQAQTQAAALEAVASAPAIGHSNRSGSGARRTMRRKSARDTERRIAGIDQERARNDAQRSLVVGAPRAGTVSGVTAVEGQHVTTG